MRKILFLFLALSFLGLNAQKKKKTVRKKKAKTTKVAKADAGANMGNVDSLVNAYAAPAVQEVPDDRTPTGNQIVNFFMNKGLTKNQAKGIYGNIMQESGGKHNIVSRDGHNSYGLAQWTGTRKARLFSKYGTNPTVNQQLEYLWSELNSTEKGALNALRNTSTVEDATKVFMQKFERPANWAANFKNRLKHANSVA